MEFLVKIKIRKREKKVSIRYTRGCWIPIGQKLFKNRIIAFMKGIEPDEP